MRVVRVENKHLTEDMATSGYADLGTFEYGYDTASNALSALQSATMDELDADRYFTHDSLKRLIILDTPASDTARVATRQVLPRRMRRVKD